MRGQMSSGRFLRMAMMMMAGAAVLGGGGAAAAGQATAGQATAGPAVFGPENPFYAPSALPYQAPPFDKIKDSDYQPALEAGIAQQLKEIQAIAENPAPPTFDNTLVALEKSGQLFDRVQAVLNAVTQANSTPVLEKVQEIEAPKIAALQDAMLPSWLATLLAVVFALIVPEMLVALVLALGMSSMFFVFLFLFLFLFSSFLSHFSFCCFIYD